ncbi:YaiI/YqxD family protein [Roseomonas chloroacetimidivorans]|uniref:YaiI/YqxD family protein n=1 Tax=Roseomonas chloroacetimidivorans TaxID=1766656 RepID=UPI003C7765B4
MDGDACPVRDEVFRVAARHGLPVTVVSNGSRGMRLPDGIRRVVVAEGPDAADDWIAEAVQPRDICVTADIPLASRCLAAGGHAVAPSGRIWDAENIGSALAGREISRHLREMGQETRHAAFSGQNRSRFLEVLEAVVQKAMRPAEPKPRAMPDFFSE